MRTFETPYISDWFAVSLRWLSLLGLTVSLALGDRLSLLGALPLMVLALWNVAMTVLAGLNMRLNRHRLLGVVVDTLMAGIFFWLQGGLTGPASWAVVLPVLTAAVYYEVIGALGVAAAMALLTLLHAFLRLNGLISYLVAASAAGGMLLFGLLFGYLGRRLTEHLRRLRLERLEREEKRRRVENERLRAIYALTSTLTATLSYKRVLDSALDLAVTALNPDAGETPDDRLVSAVLLFIGNELRVKTARRFTSADMRVRLIGSEGILGKAIRDGEPVLSTRVSYDPELSRIIALRSCTSAYCFPLRSGFDVYGVLLFAHPDPDYFTPDRREILDILGRQSVIAIQNARLYQNLVEEKERMIEVQEEARKKLARDLHDGPTQSVSAMAMRLNLARRMLERDPKSVADELLKIEELARRTTKEIRHMLFTLRPLVLESQGLRAALEAMAEKMRETYDQNVHVEIDESVVEQMEIGKQGVIFYIVEEAVNNARKHAAAANIWVRLHPLEQGLVLLEIQDDGVGFDVEKVTAAYEQRGSLGMVNLRERTELVNGLLHIDSAPGKGTNVQVFIPLTEEAADRLHHAK
ncbi:MAG: GAF domain-containing sensor histidine kinase [Anaerolineae bacterium]|nr:MAG: GAF domain-containing sensor histidine kinase [Anaerolineae bacterium]